MGAKTLQLLINIDVDDVPRAEDFYTAAFKVTVGRRFDDGFVELLGLPVPVYLLKKASGTLPFEGAGVGRSFARHWTPVHMDVIVEDLAEATLRAVAAGARAESGVIREPYGLMTFFSDPFGHGFCFIEWKGRGYDELLE
jgi:predicted enzyme related to lactoylglutathione lyase